MTTGLGEGFPTVSPSYRICATLLSEKPTVSVCHDLCEIGDRELTLHPVLVALYKGNRRSN